MIKKFLLLSLFLFLTACSSSKLKEELVSLGALPKEHTSQYLQIYNKYTQTKKIYDQFETKSIISVTYFSKEFLDGYLNERNIFLKESDFLVLQERERQISEKNLKFFISFYTPNPDFSDLDKQHSIWNVFIEKSNGIKIIPTAIRKSSEPYPVLNHFFPAIDPWSVPYIVIFPRFIDEKRSIIENEQFKLIFRSVLGTAIFTFNNN